MERRKFVIGLGALAAGGAAAAGTGAFTSVEAGREASVEITNDAEGYLSIEANPEDKHGTQYAEEEDGTIEFTFDKLNPDATTTIEDIISVKNAGTQEVEVTVEFDDPNDLVELDPNFEDGQDLGAGDPAENIDITFDTTDETPDDYGNVDVTFKADA